MTESTLPVEATTTFPIQVASQPYWQMATSANTRRAYQSDIRHFISNGGLLPATTEWILHYLHQQAAFLNPRTLKRRLVAIKHWHTYQNFSDPTIHPLIKKTMSGIARAHGRPANKAPIFSVEQLMALSAHLNNQGTLVSYRDNALLQIGFLGAFRRSELVAIQWQHVRFVPEGVEILIPRSKTDQEGEGNICAIPYGQPPLCPVTALSQWQTQSGLMDGFVFRAIRHGQCDPINGVSPAIVSQILKRRALECQWPNAAQYSGHSLRRGFATTASQRGASLGAIMRQGRWRHEGTVHGYIEEGKRFEANAAASILEQPTKLPAMAEKQRQNTQGK
jgi:integrase